MQRQPTPDPENNAFQLTDELNVDTTQFIFTESVDLEVRSRIGRTCRSGYSFFTRNLHQSFVADLRKALLANGFQGDLSHLHEIEDKHIIQFLNLLKYPYRLQRERRDFILLFSSPDIQAITNLACWQVAIFCFLLLTDVEINKPGINHVFVTTDNLSFFKELIQSPYADGRSQISDDLLDRLMKLETVKAQPLLQSTLTSDFRRPALSLFSALGQIDLGTHTSLTAEEEMGETFDMIERSPSAVLEISRRSIEDRRT